MGDGKGQWVKAAPLNLEVCSLAIFSLVLTVLPVFVPVEGFFLITVAPFPLVVLAVKYPWRYALSVLGLEAGGVLLLGGVEILLFLSQYALASVAMAWGIRRGCSIAQTMMWGLGVPLGIGGVLLVLYSVLLGQTPDALLTTYLEQVMAALQEHAQQMVDAGQQVHGEQVKTFIEAFPRFVLAIFPALLVINRLLTNVFNYLLVRYYCHRSRPPIRLDPTDLACWRASDYTVWVFLGSGVALLLPIASVSAIGLNVFLMTLAVYLLQGIAIAVFWGRRIPFPLGVRCLLALMVFLLAAPLCIGLCIAAGLFDLWIDFRRQRGRSMVS